MAVARWIVCSFAGDRHVECQRCGEHMNFVLPQEVSVVCAVLKDFYIDHMHCQEKQVAA
jgi:hypothetical protein